MILGPSLFVAKLRRLSPQMAIGRANETVATMLFALLFPFALGKAFLPIRRREVSLHR